MVTASVLVERATTSALIGPDWAMNLEICDTVNQDPGQAKDVVKVIKKRLNNKNPKVQLLALTILETLMKNCGALVHQLVAEKDILPKMVKMVKKKGDMHVKDKVLGLLDAWQEAFGGPAGTLPQYYYAYEELRRIGVQFPERIVEDGPPLLTPPQTHPLSSYRSPGFGSPRYVPTRSDAPVTTEAPEMSLADIETARGSLEVLNEMLNAVNPHDRLAVKDELIVELVDQCRATQSRVRHLVNATTNEELLRQGLSLNDDLQRVLVKHDAIRSGAPLPKEEPLLPSSRKVHGPDDTTYDRKDRSSKSLAQDGKSSSTPLIQLALPPPSQSATSKSSPPAQRQPAIDLLSGDVYEDRSTPPPATSPLISQSAGELVLYSPAADASNAFAPGLLQNTPPLQHSVGMSDQWQNSQQYPPNGNPQYFASTNGSSQQYSLNGNMVGQFQGFPQQPYQMYQSNTATQPFVLPVQNNYVASWAMTDGQFLSSQQNRLILHQGLENPQLQPPPQWNAYNGHNGLASSPGLDSPPMQLPSKQSITYPPAPWRETMAQPMSPQQRAMLYGNSNSTAPSILTEMQLYPQQPSMSFDQPMRLHTGGAQQNTMNQPWTSQQAYSLQYTSQIGQARGEIPVPFANQPQASYLQSASGSSKPVNPADKFFDDLVDVKKLSSKLKAAQISSNNTRPSTSKSTGNA